MELPQNTEDARKIQLELREKVKIVPLRKSPRFIAGVDAAFSGDNVIAAACLFKYPELIHIEDACAIKKVTFPYIPGLLSFREGPAIIEAVSKLHKKPDLILFDGQGIAHPIGMGIAAHMGVLLEIPAIGCAKSKLVGEYKEPGNTKGQFTELKHKGRVVGMVLRTRRGVKPLFVSPGHMIDLRGAVEVVLTCTGKYRIPEPLRRADHLSKLAKSSQQFSLL